MKKLILLISLITVSVLFSGCCHLLFWPCSPNMGGGPAVIHPGGHGR
jgi:hypothetical protein